MEKFKSDWEIQENWQLIFPAIGIIALGFSSYRFAHRILSETNFISMLILSIVLFFGLLIFILFLFKKLKSRWKLTYRWEMIRVFIVFALTGMSSLYIGRPVMALAGITKENLNPIIYWVLFIIIGLIFYQILLVSFGWLLGQFEFFWEFEKKMLKRLGFKRFLD